MTEQSLLRRALRQLLRRHYVTAAVFLVVALIVDLISTQPKLRQTLEQDQPGLVPVTYVDDGDTIKVKLPGGEDTVRLIGADTPEVKDPRKPVQCYGEIASNHTKKTLPIGTKVRLVSDSQDQDRDKYGRLLRYVYLADGTDYNAELIKDGYAFAYVVFPFSKLGEFKADEASAKAAGTGLWSACNINSSDIIKQTAGNK